MVLDSFSLFFCLFWWRKKKSPFFPCYLLRILCNFIQKCVFSTLLAKIGDLSDVGWWNMWFKHIKWILPSAYDIHLYSWKKMPHSDERKEIYAEALRFKKYQFAFWFVHSTYRPNYSTNGDRMEWKKKQAGFLIHHQGVLLLFTCYDGLFFFLFPFLSVSIQQK